MMLQMFKNKHLGETCIVIANGPSLNNVKNAFLDLYPTFGANRIFLKYTPTYYVCINPLVIEQNRTIIKMLSCEKFMPFGTGIDCNAFFETRTRKFCKNADQAIYGGYTVTFVSLQLAYYMGFTNVLLVGLDHHYEYEGKPNETLQMIGDDPNHFSKEYFKGMLWHAPDLAQSEISYQMAQEVYCQEDRHIYNLTKDSKCKVFPFDDTKNWIYV